MSDAHHASPPAPATPNEAIELLKAQKDAGARLLASLPIAKADYTAWETATREALVKAFGPDSANIDSVLDIGKYGSFPMGVGDDWWEKHRAKSLERQLVMIDNLVELLETEARLAAGLPAQTAPAVHGDRVFLVHTRTDAMLQATARLLDRLGLPVTILREEPKQGRSIIEKVTDYADVGFAVVLLTPDERGGMAGELYETQRTRARQNVVLELGFFLGRLGRKRVCALYQKGIELPSDHQGLMYVPVDDGGAWKLELAKALKSAGLPVDLNRAF